MTIESPARPLVAEELAAQIELLQALLGQGERPPARREFGPADESERSRVVRAMRAAGLRSGCGLEYMTDGEATGIARRLGLEW